MVVLTFREHGRLTKQIKEIPPFEGTTYYPTPEEIESCYLNNEKYVDECKFVLTLEWLIEKNEPPKTKEEELSRKAMLRYTREHLVIVSTQVEKKRWLREYNKRRNVN